MSTASFAYQDLRDRSFREQILVEADFSGADLRGCDFSRAKLVGACFDGARCGTTWRQRWVPLALSLGVLALVGDCISRLVFAALGQTAGDQAWSYVLVLYGFLGLAGAAAGVRALTGAKSPDGRVAAWIAGVTVAALLGFFYAGSSTNNDSKIAILGAIAAGLLVALLGWRWKTRLFALASMTGGMVAGYGFAFLVGGMAAAFLSVQQWLWGIPLGGISLLSVGLTLRSLLWVLQAIQQAGGTSFRGADLTDATFLEVRWE